MIKSVVKAMAILKLLSKQPQKEFSPSEIARILGMERPTCANIIKTLLDGGYVQQSTPRGGYKLGYALYQMTSGEVMNEELTKIAREDMEILGRELNETTLLSVIRNDKRISLYSTTPDRTMFIRPSEDKSVYMANTGRVILANYSPSHLERFIIRNGIPSKKEWPEIYVSQNPEGELRNLLSSIRNNGYSIQIDDNDLIGFAVPLFNEGHVIGSIGTFLPKYRIHNQTHILHTLFAAAEKINKKIALSLRT